jgi:hypothetical protein
MRIVYVIAIAVLMSPCYGKAQQKSGEGLGCFEDLVAPEYPKAALQAHIDGTVWTTTQVNPQGGIGKIETQVVSAWADGSKLLTPPVEKAIRAAKVKSECAGKSVPVVFRYQLFGEPVPNPKATSRTEKPNILWIESQPESIKPQH